jgi:hypothetical protein
MPQIRTQDNVKGMPSTVQGVFIFIIIVSTGRRSNASGTLASIIRGSTTSSSSIYIYIIFTGRGTTEKPVIRIIRTRWVWQG